MTASNLLPDTVRVCPICEHRQHRNDPTRHVCASVLRESLRQARAQLNSIALLVDDSDPVAGARRLSQECEAIPRLEAAANTLGRREGVSAAIESVRGLMGRMRRQGRRSLFAAALAIEFAEAARVRRLGDEG